MVRKRIHAVFLGLLLVVIAPACWAQYTTDWLANTYGTDATHVGNTARSMWVAPEGVIYTASFWDEDEGGVAIARDGSESGAAAAGLGSAGFGGAGVRTASITEFFVLSIA